MRSTRRPDFYLPLATVLVDALAIEAAFILAYWIRSQSGLFDGLGFVREAAPPFSSYVLGSLVVAGIWLLLFQARKMYGTRRAVTLADELLNIVRVVTLGMLIVLTIAFFYRDFSYSRIVIVLAYGLSIALLFLGRASIRWVERRLYRRGRHLLDAIILGSDDPAAEIFRRLHKHPSFGFNLLGYFADGDPAPPSPVLPRLGTWADAPAYIRARNIQLAFIAMHRGEQSPLMEVMAGCEGVNIEFMMVPDVLEVMTSQVRLRELEGIPFLTLKGIPMTTWGRISKRAFDITVSACSLVAALPLGAMIALAVRMDSPGPVLFRQRRVGMDGREFTMLKFRSMRHDAPTYEESVTLGIRNDPRRTRVGRFLRTTSLDELPQLLNVLVGDMSLVGPRPERPTYVEELRKRVPRYMDRLRVRAGVTGWAQVNGLRGDTSIAERVKYDLYYIENWSLSFDVKILLRTLSAAVSRHETGSA